MKNKLYLLSNYFHIKKLENIIVRFLTAWIISLDIISLNSSSVVTEKYFIMNKNTITTVLFTVAFFVLINFFYRMLHKLKLKIEFESILLLIFSVLYFSSSAIFETDVYFSIMISALTVILSVYTVNCNKDFVLKKELRKRSFVSVTAIGICVSLTIVTLIGVFRCLTFSSPNFDLGIFVNTAYNLKTKLIQYNTCERDALITHFGVHVSPILYLLTPFYFLFPSAITLQIVEALLVISSVFPVYFLCKKYELKNITAIFMCLITVFYPALSTGTFYDFHENAFLTPLLLWMIYFCEKNKRVPMYIFMALSLFVKEDATIYVAVFGVYMLFAKKEKLDSVIMIIVPALYLVGCMWYINKFGFGAMTNRFNDYIISGNMGLISVLFTMFTSPIYVIKNSISSEKLTFIFQVMAPLMFMPFVTKKMSRYILIIPFVLMNLMPSYEFQHSINFQYLYGVIALLLYLSIVNISDLSLQTKRKIVLSSLMVTLVMYSSFVVPKLSYIERYNSNRSDYKKIEEVLDKLPQEASVTASTFFIPYIANRDVIYEYEYTEHETEYIVFDLRYEQTREDEKELDKDKYMLIGRYENLISLYKLKE